MLPAQLQWERIRFLYENFLLFTFVSVVVAFQPEIRRAFMQLGQARLFRGAGPQVEATITSLLESASYLSRNKMGAIVAVERTVGLGGLVESGTPMDANLTAALLNTIFYPGGALHDMGVIVRNGKVAAAGCQFPLAEADEVDPSLGSRHRAALGLSKESDAAIIIVSEETGRISLALDGQLYLGLELENLRGMLISLLGPSSMLRRRGRPKGDSA
jgi:diadenylate cyclase